MEEGERKGKEGTDESKVKKEEGLEGKVGEGRAWRRERKGKEGTDSD